MTAVVLVFVLVDVGTMLGGLPWLKLRRTAWPCLAPTR